MKILKFKMYKDGGTVEISTNKGIFCFDNRMFNKTKGMIYDGYPKGDNSNLIENSEKLKMELIEKLENYKNESYQSSIDHFIKKIN